MASGNVRLEFACLSLSYVHFKLLIKIFLSLNNIEVKNMAKKRSQSGQNSFSLKKLVTTMQILFPPHIISQC